MTVKAAMLTGSGRWTVPVLVTVVALAGCVADRAYRSGLKGLEEGRYEEAVASLEKAHKHEPDNPVFRSALRTGREQVARRLANDGERNFAAGRLDAAEKAYRRLAEIEPGNARAAAGLDAVAKAKRHAPLIAEANRLYQEKDYSPALGKARQILAENPQHAEAAALAAKIEEMQVRDAHAPIRLKSRYVKPVSLQFRDGNIRQVFEALSKTTGINFIFDNDVKNGVKVTIFVNQVSVEDAIDLILAQSQLAQKILNDNTVLIYPSTAQKHKEYQEQIIRSFYLTNIEPKKAQSMLKTMLDAGRSFIDEKTNLLVLRDTPEIVRMAEKLMVAADLPEPEVMLEVEVLEIKRSTLQQLGIDYPDKITLSATNAAGETDKLTMADVGKVNSSRVLVSPLSVGIDITKQDSDANVLASPRVRARNKEKARIHIGDRVPVITTISTPSTGGPVNSTSVQYLDVGLKLEIEPTVHLDNDVAIKLNLEVSSIVREVKAGTGGAESIAYQIGTRNASTLLRLRDGETQVLAGLISDEERVTANKIPGLGDIPVLGRLFSTQKDDATKTEIVLSITPRLIRNIARPDAGTTEFWYGSETSKRGKPLTIQSVSRGEPIAPVAPPPAAPEAALVSAPTAPPPAEPAGEASVADEVAPVPLVFEGPDRVSVGQEFEVALTIKADQPVSGVTFQIGYEPAVFEVVSVAEGSFLRQTGSSEQFSHEINRESGRIDVKIAPGEGKGATGAAEVVIVTFKAVGAKARSPVSMRNVVLLGPDGRTIKAVASAPLLLAASPH
jgi:general secretion pathway protein D